MHMYPLVFTMSLKQKVVLASMIIRGVATFGLLAYTMVNFVKWMMDTDQEIEGEYSEENVELSFT